MVLHDSNSYIVAWLLMLIATRTKVKLLLDNIGINVVSSSLWMWNRFAYWYMLIAEIDLPD